MSLGTKFVGRLATSMGCSFCMALMVSSSGSGGRLAKSMGLQLATLKSVMMSSGAINIFIIIKRLAVFFFFQTLSDLK